MRSSTGGLTYAQMGRFQSAGEPRRSRGTSDEEAALTTRKANGLELARNTWVNVVALATALNVSYMAEQISIFGIVVGSRSPDGIGLVDYRFAVFGREPRRPRAR